MSINQPNNPQTSPPPSTISSVRGQRCAACRFRRKKCPPDCVLAPYFPQTNPAQFENAHKVFGVSNMIKVLKNLDPIDRQFAAESMIYEASVRAGDPIGGCYRVILDLRRRIDYYEGVIGFFRRRHRTQEQELGNLNFGLDINGCVLGHRPVNFSAQEQQLENPYFDLDSNGCLIHHRPENFNAQEQGFQSPNFGLDINGCLIRHPPENFSAQEQGIQNSYLGGPVNFGPC